MGKTFKDSKDRESKTPAPKQAKLAASDVKPGAVSKPKPVVPPAPPEEKPLKKSQQITPPAAHRAEWTVETLQPIADKYGLRLEAKTSRFSVWSKVNGKRVGKVESGRGILTCFGKAQRASHTSKVTTPAEAEAFFALCADTSADWKAIEKAPKPVKDAAPKPKPQPKPAPQPAPGAKPQAKSPAPPPAAATKPRPHDPIKDVVVVGKLKKPGPFTR